MAGVAEVLHAEWRDHAYPAHTHDTWTLLLVDDGLIGYELDRHDHAAPRSGVTLLPPHVVHDGYPVTSHGFRKRVLYLEEQVLSETLIGAAVDAPLIDDRGLREQVSRLDRALVRGDEREAESRLALVAEHLAWHLTGRHTARSLPSAGPVARQAREILDADQSAPRALPALLTPSGSARRTLSAHSRAATASRRIATCSGAV